MSDRAPLPLPDSGPLDQAQSNVICKGVAGYGGVCGVCWGHNQHAVRADRMWCSKSSLQGAECSAGCLLLLLLLLIMPLCLLLLLAQ